ncbi:hypothetical protein [Roseibium sp.]|uniref:hypothetical protein n=1 Tax=Roseibium sp. TaxID=1936156 RepID=UPI003BB0C737
MLSLLLVMPLAGLAVFLAPGKVFAAEALDACTIDLATAIPVHPAGEELLFEAEDGTSFRASDLRIPESAETSHAAVWPANETDVLAVPAGSEDRWGRVPSWIILRRDGSLQIWQSSLLEQGAAFFAPLHAEAGCAEALRRAEGRARQESTGLWREGGAGLAYRTDRPDAFADAEGRYVIARGRVVSLGKTRSTRYLNFGRYWKTDVTGTVRVSDEDDFNAALARRGWHLDGLAGRVVELRGVVELRDGPHIALRNPEQLVVLEDKRAGRERQGNN